MFIDEARIRIKAGDGGNGGMLAGIPLLHVSPDGGKSWSAVPIHYLLDGFAPVSLICQYPNLMVVPNSSPAKSVKEFIDHAKANPGKTTFASTGIGASPHLSGELFRRKAGIEMTHVPYRGAGPAMNDLIPGRVDAMFSNLPGVLPQVQSGTIRGLAVTSAKRSGEGS